MKITDIQKTNRPIKVMQFGGGVFLRGFFDWMLAKANACGAYCGDAVIVRAKTRGEDPLAKQNFMYTHVARDGEHSDVTLVDCLQGSLDPASDPEGFFALAATPSLEIVVSNTTEAGIVYQHCDRPDGVAESFPARLTQALYHRFSAGLGGLLILPCELIEDNGDTLRSIVLRHAEDWGLGEEFCAYVKEQCAFRNTLVDRIVSGAPLEKVPLDYEDELVNTSEYFHLFVIEGEADPRMPFLEAGINIKWVPRLADYRTLKVRILNGAHTSMIPHAMLRGLETVGDCMADATMRGFLENCLSEILPTLDFDRAEAEAYAAETLKRFANPHIRHLCAAISLNSVAKFRVRVLPSILAYREKFGKVPPHLAASFDYLVAFYQTGTPRDDEAVIASMKRPREEILADVSLWGTDLTGLL